MNEQEFKDHYVATFLATHAAMHYDNACAMGQHDKLEKHLAVEDAKYLSDRAWEQLKPNAPDQARLQPSPEAGCSPSRYGAKCPSCGRDNSEYDNICTSDDCPANNALCIKRIVGATKGGEV